MRRHLTILAALLLALPALPMPNAFAEPRHAGDCHLAAVRDHTGTVAPPDQISGVVFVAMAVYDDDGTHNPASATVECILRINGTVRVVILTATGTGVIVDARTFAATVREDDHVELCTRVTYGSGKVEEDCKDIASVDVLPRELNDVLATAFDTADAARKAFVDPLLCPVLATLTPGVPPLRIEPDGDVVITSYRRTVMYARVYDCPPYAGQIPIAPAPEPFVTLYYA